MSPSALIKERLFSKKNAPGTQVTTRTVNERNQLVLTNQGGVTTTMHYDANGNLTAIRPAGVVTTGAKIYGYDQRNLMVTEPPSM